MTDDDVRFSFDHPITFRTPDGGEAELHATSMLLDDEVRLTATVALADWERLFAAGAFHLDGEPAPVGFEEGRTVRLELRLRAKFAALVEDPEALLHDLLTDDTYPLRQSEAWEATEAMQRLPIPGMDDAWTEIGIRTRFAHPD